MLIALAGLPGTGKTTIARLLARRLGALHLRIDTIEQALLRSGSIAALGAEGYAVACAIAADNLRLGHTVIADCVNALEVARSGWRGVAEQCRVPHLFVHLVCSDANEHERRLSHRSADIEGHVLPTWAQVSAMRFEPMSPGVRVIDTQDCAPEAAAERVLRDLGALRPVS